MFVIRRLTDPERPALRQFWVTHWGDEVMVMQGGSYHVDQFEAFVAQDQDEWIGVVTFRIDAAVCVIMSLDSLRTGVGVGAALMKAVEQQARQAGCSVMKLVTTNDNTHALRFYQKLGFELTALYPRSIESARKLKPSIPEIGQDGIPIRDELELQYHLV